MQRAAQLTGPVESTRSAVSSLQAFPVLLGLFLLVTAVLKALSAADAAATQSLYAVPHWLQVVAVQAEIAVGVLLMSGLGPRQAWRATVALFLTFASMSLYRALAGLESCGCFGSFKINPWWTFGLDVAILLLLAYRRQDFLRDVEAARSEKWPWLGGYALLASLAITEMVSSAPIRYEAAKPILDGQLVILEPEKWPGQPFSLSEHVEPEIEFSKGDWIILMYHHDCPSCQEAVPRYEQLAIELAGSGNAPAVLLLEVPPYGHASSGALGAARHAKLSNNREWFVQAPVEIQLRDGVVSGASLELPAIDSPESNRSEF